MREEFRVFIDAENEEIKEDDEITEEGQVAHQQENKKEDLVFEILSKYVEQVKEACIKRNFPLIEEYDFKRATLDRSPDLKIELKSST